jgi:hypothetical protein
MSEKQLVFNFFKSIISSNKRFTVPSGTGNGVDVAIKIADVCDEWKKFQYALNKYEGDNNVNK